MASDETYSNSDPVAITLTVAEWETVRHWLTYGQDVSRAKMHQWEIFKDKQGGQAKMGHHERAAAEAERLCKIIEETINPYPAPGI